MNSIKIEKGAIDTLRRIIRLHDKMDEFLNSNDKEPSWDGNIVIYKNSELKAEDVEYTIPTQVKGKNDERLLKRNRITYPVEYKHLRNYFNNNGIFYFVIAISDDGEKTTIFYNALTTIKLQSILKGTENKNPDQTKNIPLVRLRNNDKNELYKILMQFGHDSREVGSGELVKKSISMKDLEKIDSIRMTTFASNQDEFLENINSGEVCAFGHIASADIWVPFSYDFQKQIELFACEKIADTFSIDRIPYYKEFEIRKSTGKSVIFQFSENLYVDIGVNKIEFKAKTYIDQVMRDIQFLEALKNGKSFYIGDTKIGTYENVNFGDDLETTINDFKNIQEALIRFNLKLDKKFADFNDKDWESMDNLVKLVQNGIKLNKQMTWYMWWWQDKAVPFFVALDKDGNVKIENSLYMKYFRIVVANSDYRVPVFILFKRDIWEKLYDVDESVLLEEIESSIFNNETEGNFSLLFVEILSAYDENKDEKYYDVAKLISDKLLNASPGNVYWKINRFQLLKRKRDLSEDELQELEDLEKANNDKKVLCAINILLENKRKAKKLLDEMGQEDRELFLTYPIYNLLV